MIKLLPIIFLISSVSAQEVVIDRFELGSGIPGKRGVEPARGWKDGIYHAPQYMPGYPTAAPIFPRVIDVECQHVENGLKCNGYNWSPGLGRGEYLFIRPSIKEKTPNPPTITEVQPTIIIIETLPKKQKE